MVALAVLLLTIVVLRKHRRRNNNWVLISLQKDRESSRAISVIQNAVYQNPLHASNAGNAYGSLMPTYGQVTPVAGGGSAEAAYAHLDHGGASA